MKRTNSVGSIFNNPLINEHTCKGVLMSKKYSPINYCKAWLFGLRIKPGKILAMDKPSGTSFGTTYWEVIKVRRRRTNHPLVALDVISYHPSFIDKQFNVGIATRVKHFVSGMFKRKLTDDNTALTGRTVLKRVGLNHFRGLTSYESQMFYE